MNVGALLFFFFFSSRRRHTRLTCDWSSDVCSSDLPGSCVLPKAIGATFSNHLRCGGLRRCVMKACPICSSRVAKPASGVPAGESPREGVPSQFDLGLRASLLAGDLHTQERSQYCRTGFPIGSSWLPLQGHSGFSFG